MFYSLMTADFLTTGCCIKEGEGKNFEEGVNPGGGASPHRFPQNPPRSGGGFSKKIIPDPPMGGDFLRFQIFACGAYFTKFSPAAPIKIVHKCI